MTIECELAELVNTENLRGLMNVRRPGRISDGFLAVQDEYLREETARNPKRPTPA